MFDFAGEMKEPGHVTVDLDGVARLATGAVQEHSGEARGNMGGDLIGQGGDCRSRSG